MAGEVEYESLIDNNSLSPMESPDTWRVVEDKPATGATDLGGAFNDPSIGG